MTMELVRKYAAPVPRYTSYPTALSFSPRVGSEIHAKWLQDLPLSDPISLYVHIPYCKSICWYCACHAKAARKAEPIRRYLDALEAEISLVEQLIPQGVVVKNIHWGGGSPNSLEASDIKRLTEMLRGKFHVEETAQFAVEIDPRTLSEEQAAAFTEAGVNRASLGVQDFDDGVQEAIGRIQSFETTLGVAKLLRSHGINSINVDLVYGLPRQTRESAENTIKGVLEINPDRIALFGYAHMPSKFKRQRLVDDDALPGVEQRFDLSNLMANRLMEAGYVRVGLDHFARPEDSLANGPVHRNFQGYTSDTATSLIGFGATAISKFPDGYVQNVVPVGEYERLVMAGRLPSVRGYEMSDMDRMRAFAIERLMCDLAFPADGLRKRFGEASKPLFEDAISLVEADRDGLVEGVGEGFFVTEKGRPFLRSISAHFDDHLISKQTRFSTGV